MLKKQERKDGVFSYYKNLVAVLSVCANSKTLLCLLFFCLSNRHFFPHLSCCKLEDWRVRPNDLTMKGKTWQFTLKKKEKGNKLRQKGYKIHAFQIPGLDWLVRFTLFIEDFSSSLPPMSCRFYFSRRLFTCRLVLVAVKNSLAIWCHCL